jgi:hypothetical protein
MLVYTITVNVESSVAEEWLVWMKENFLKPIVATDIFEKYHAFKVLHDSDGDTYTFQFFCKNILQYKKFQDEHKNDILHALMNSFPGKVVYFNTMLEEVIV